MHVAALIMEFHLPGCNSLKEKRSRLKPILLSLHREFNVSAAEIEENDQHRFAVIACVLVSKDPRYLHKVLMKIPNWVEGRRFDLELVDEELIPL
jgi:uncharacterized protein YlxP (DUF503 family)